MPSEVRGPVSQPSPPLDRAPGPGSGLLVADLDLARDPEIRDLELMAWSDPVPRARWARAGQWMIVLAVFLPWVLFVPGFARRLWRDARG